MTATKPSERRAPAPPSTSIQTHVGVATQVGRRKANEDFAHARAPAGRGLMETVAAIADGMGGGPAGRLAAETTVRGFFEAYESLPATLGVDRAAARALSAMNRWVHAQGQQDPRLKNMATTFSALILRGRQAHVIHIGDTRVYRLRDDSLVLLTRDHVHQHPDLKHVLHRAVGLEENVRADYSLHELRAHDRYLLCSDGVHGVLDEAKLKATLAERESPTVSAERVIAAALAAGSQDNVTAIVLDVVAVPAVDRLTLEHDLAELPILDLPSVGQTIDGFRLLAQLSDGRYSRLFRAEDTIDGREVTLKFPHPRVTGDDEYRRAFLREAWVAGQIQSPYVVDVIELPPGRRTRLYSVMPYYDGELLEARLRRAPVSLADGVDIGLKLAKAVYVLNRARIIHRDIKPENVMLLPADAGGLKLLDLGVARLPGLEDEHHATSPGTPSYMAPELFAGAPGDERSDVYALGVTLYRLFSGGHYPYGEVEPFMRPRFSRRTPLSRHRPDLPAWLDDVLAKATAVDTEQRFGDAMELAFALENGLARGAQVVVRPTSLYQRNPLRFWQTVSALLALALLLSWVLR